MTLPVDYANATVSLDAHPDAHNTTNAAVNDLDTRVTDIETADAGAAVAAHLADSADAHDASAISFTPTGSLAATDVQSAIAELSGGATITVASSAPGSPTTGDLWIDTT